MAKYCGELVNIGGKGVVNIGAGGGGLVPKHLCLKPYMKILQVNVNA